MLRIHATSLPADALLAAYARSGAYTDCYSASVAQHISLAGFMEAFYTTRLFKAERWILAHTFGLPSTDKQARELARGAKESFAAWQVEAREPYQAILAAGRTRSWFMVQPCSVGSDRSTSVLFGSAIVPRQRGGLGWQYRGLLGFHKLYSRLLLGAAIRRLATGRCASDNVEAD